LTSFDDLRQSFGYNGRHTRESRLEWSQTAEQNSADHYTPWASRPELLIASGLMHALFFWPRCKKAGLEQ
jgi:hypothetical protein